MNSSKKGERRFWRRWFVSGAVAQQQFPHNSLLIDAIATHYEGLAAGNDVLSLGRRVAWKGLGTVIYEPLCAIVVPTSGKNRLGKVLRKVPANAVPFDVFFEEP